MNYNFIFMRKSISPYNVINENIGELNKNIVRLKNSIDSELSKLKNKSSKAVDFVNTYINTILSRDYYANGLSASYEHDNDLEIKKTTFDLSEAYKKFLSSINEIKKESKSPSRILYKDMQPKYFIKSGNDVTTDIKTTGEAKYSNFTKRIVSTKVLTPLGCTLNGETVMAFIKIEFEQASTLIAGETERVTECRLMMMPPNETKWVDAPTKVYDLQGELIGDLNIISTWTGPPPTSLGSNKLVLGLTGETYEERFKKVVFKTTDSGTILLIMLNPAEHDALTILRYDESKMCWFALINSRFGLDVNGDLYSKVLSPLSSTAIVGRDVLSHYGKPMLTGVSQKEDGSSDYHYDNLSIDETYVYDENGKRYYTLYICYGLGKEHDFAIWTVQSMVEIESFTVYRRFRNDYIPSSSNSTYVFTSTYSEDFSYQNNSFQNIMSFSIDSRGWYFGISWLKGRYEDVYFDAKRGYESGIHTIPTYEMNCVVTSFRIPMVSVASCKPGSGPILRFMFTFYMNPDKFTNKVSVAQSKRKVYTFGCLDLDCQTGAISVSKDSWFSMVAIVGDTLGLSGSDMITSTMVHSTHRPFCTTFDKEMEIYQFSERIRLPFADYKQLDGTPARISQRSFLDVKLICPKHTFSTGYTDSKSFTLLPLYDYNIHDVNTGFGDTIYATESLFPTASLHDISKDTVAVDDSICILYRALTDGEYTEIKDRVIQFETWDIDFDLQHKLLNHMCMNPLSYTIADDQDMEIYPSEKYIANTKNKLGKILVPFLTNIYTLHLVDVEQFFRCNIENGSDYYDAPDYYSNNDGYTTSSWSIYTTTERYGEPVKKDIVMRLNVKGKYKRNRSFDTRSFADMYRPSAEGEPASAYRYSIDPNSEITFEYVYLGEDDVCRSVKFLTFGKSDPTSQTNNGILHYKEHHMQCGPDGVDVVDVPFDIPLTELKIGDKPSYLPTEDVSRKCNKISIAFKLTGTPNLETCAIFDLVLFSENYPFMKDTRRFMITWKDGSWYIDFVRKEYPTIDGNRKFIFPISKYSCKLDVLKETDNSCVKLVFWNDDPNLDLNCSNVGDIENLYEKNMEKSSNFVNNYIAQSRFLADKYKDHDGPYNIACHNMRLNIVNVGVPVGTDDGETPSYEIDLEGVQLTQDTADTGMPLGSMKIFCESEIQNINEPINIGTFS